MTNWIIAADGSAVNLDRVERVTVEMRSTHQDLTPWYVLAKIAGQHGAGVALAQNFKDRAEALDWIRKAFTGMDEHADQAMALTRRLLGQDA